MSEMSCWSFSATFINLLILYLYFHRSDRRSEQVALLQFHKRESNSLHLTRPHWGTQLLILTTSLVVKLLNAVAKSVCGSWLVLHFVIMVIVTGHIFDSIAYRIHLLQYIINELIYERMQLSHASILIFKMRRL